MNAFGKLSILTKYKQLHKLWVAKTEWSFSLEKPALSVKFSALCVCARVKHHNQKNLSNQYLKCKVLDQK